MPPVEKKPKPIDPNDLLILPSWMEGQPPILPPVDMVRAATTNPLLDPPVVPATTKPVVPEEPKKEERKGDLTINGGYERFRGKIITAASAFEERKYCHELIGAIKPDFSTSVPAEDLGIIGPKTKKQTFALQKELGISADSIFGPATQYGLIAAANNENKIDDNVKLATQAFEKLRSRNKDLDIALITECANAAFSNLKENKIESKQTQKFAESYLIAKRLGKDPDGAHEMAMRMTGSSIELNPAQKTEPEIKPTTPANIDFTKRDAAKSIEEAPFSHHFIMACEGFEPRLKDNVMIAFGVHNIHDDKKAIPVAIQYKGKTITQEEGYALMKTVIPHKRDLCQKYLPGYDNLKPHQQDALLSLVYNMNDSTTMYGLKDMKAALASGDMERVANTFDNYVHDTRRNFEAEYFRGKDIQGLAQKMADFYYERPKDAELRAGLLGSAKVEAESIKNPPKKEQNEQKEVAVIEPTKLRTLAQGSVLIPT